MRRRALLSAPLLAMATGAAAQGAAWAPDRPLRLVIPFAPGGSLDVIARVVQPHLQAVLGQGSVIDNRPGAGTIIGTDAVAKLPADGHTALLIANSFTINATLMPNPPFDARRDFTGIAYLAFNPHLLVAGPHLPPLDVAGVVAAARAKAGGLSYASSGTGTSLHLGGETFRLATGAPLVHVPYRGSPQALTDLVAGNVDLMFANLPDALPAVREGRVRPVALAAARRHPLLPDVPTFEEQGVRGVVSNSWFGLVARRETPAAALERLHAVVTEALALPSAQDRLSGLGLETRAMSRAEFDAFLREQFEANARLIREARITLE